MSSIDKRIVEMELRNKNFESNAKQSMETINKLEKALSMDTASDGIEDLSKSLNKLDLSPISSSIETISERFSTFGVVATTALQNLTNSAIDFGKNLVNAVAFEPVAAGFEEYELKMGAIQTILANTARYGTTIEDVNKTLDELNLYADKTIYNFQQMTSSIGTFTTAGVDLETATKSVKGIANLAAFVGAPASDASRAMFQLAQALSTGDVRLQDWMSLENTAGMAGKEFQDRLIETSRVLNTGVDDAIEKNGNFRESLKEGWLTTEVLTTTLSMFANEIDEVKMKQMGFTDAQISSAKALGGTAEEAATVVKTYTQMIDTMKESLQSSWTESWEHVIGNMDEAKELFTSISQAFDDIVGSSARARNEMLKYWHDYGGRTAVIEGLGNAFKFLTKAMAPIGKAWSEVFPATTGQKLVDLSNKFLDFTRGLTISGETLGKIHDAFKGLFSVGDIVRKLFVTMFKAAEPLFSLLGKGASIFLDVAAAIGRYISYINETKLSQENLNRVVQITHNFFDNVASAAKKAANIVSPIVTALGGLFSAIGEQAVNGLKTIGKSFANFAFSKIEMPSFGEMGGFLESAESSMQALSLIFVDGINQITKKVKDFKFEDIFSGLSKGFDFITVRLGSFGPIAEKIGSTIKIVAESMKGLLGDVGGWIENLLSKFTVGNVTDVVSTGFLGALVLGLKEFIGSTKDLVDGIKETLDTVRDCLEAYQNSLKAKTLITIAGAIAILAGSLVAIASIPTEKLGPAVLGMAAAGVELAAIMKVFSGLSGTEGFSSLTKVGVGLTAISGAILILANAMKSVKDLNWEEIAKGLVTVTGLAAGLAALTIVLQKNEASFVKGGVSLLAYAVAVKQLAGAVADIGAIDGNIGSTLLALGGLLAEIGAFIKLSGIESLKVLNATALIQTVSAISLLVVPLTTLAHLDTDSAVHGLTSMMVLIGEISLMVALLSETNGGKLIASATGIQVLGVAMIEFAAAAAIFGNMSLETLAKGLIALGASLIELSVAAGLMEGALPGAAAMVVMASSIALLTPSLISLSLLPFTALISGLAGIGLAIGGMAGLSSILMPLLPAMELMAVGIAKFSGSIVILDAAIAGFGVAMATLASGLAVMGTIGVAGEKIGQIIAGIGNSILARIPSMGANILIAVSTIIQAIVGAIVDSASSIANGFLTIGLLVINTVTGLAVPLANAFVTILTAALRAINASIGEIADLAAAIVIAFTNGIANNIGGIIQAGYNFIVEFINGMAEALRGNTEPLFKAIKNFVSSIIEFILSALQELVKAIPGVGDFLYDSLGKAKDKVRKTLAPSDFSNMSKGAMNGLKSGITSSSSSILTASQNVGNNAKSGITNSMLGVGEIGKSFGTQFSNGLSSTSQLSNAAGMLVSDQGALGISSTGGTKYSEYGETYGNDFAKSLGLQGENSMLSGKSIATSAVNGLLADQLKFAQTGSKYGNDFATEISNKSEKANIAARKVTASAETGLKSNQTVYGQTGTKYGNDFATNLNNKAPNANQSGKNVTNNAETGLKSNQTVYGQTGTKYGNDFATNMSKQQTNSNNAGRNLTTKAETGLKSNQTVYGQTGKTYGTNFVSGVNDQAGNAKSAGTNLSNSLASGLTNNTSLTNAGATAGAKFSDGVNSKAANAKAAGKNLADNAGTGASQNAATFTGAGSGGSSNYVRGIDSKQGTAKSAGINLSNAGINGTNSASKGWESAGKSAADGYAKGMKSNSESVNTVAKNIAQAAIEAAKKQTKTNSPSKVYEQLGKWNDEGYILGMKKMKGAVATEAANVAKVGISSISKAINASKELASDIMLGFDVEDPVISPVIDLTDVINGTNDIEKRFRNLEGLSISATADIAEATAKNITKTKEKSEKVSTKPEVENVKNYQFVQNNYSPTALSRTDIYRQTKNQFALMKGVIGE